MTEEEAIAIADAFIHQQLGPDPRLRGDRYTYVCLGARMSKNQEWSVIYQLVFPDRPDRVWDGPAVVIIDPVTRAAAFFE